MFLVLRLGTSSTTLLLLADFRTFFAAACRGAAADCRKAAASASTSVGTFHLWGWLVTSCGLILLLLADFRTYFAAACRKPAASASTSVGTFHLLGWLEIFTCSLYKVTLPPPRPTAACRGAAAASSVGPLLRTGSIPVPTSW